LFSLPVGMAITFLLSLAIPSQGAENDARPRQIVMAIELINQFSNFPG
jgi:hypothetical protein